MIVKREFVQLRTTYLLREDDGSYLRSLTFRDVMTLVAAEQGRVRARRRRCHAPYFYDEFLHPECDECADLRKDPSALVGQAKRPFGVAARLDQRRALEATLKAADRPVADAVVVGEPGSDL